MGDTYTLYKELSEEEKNNDNLKIENYPDQEIQNNVLAFIFTHVRTINYDAIAFANEDIRHFIKSEEGNRYDVTDHLNSTFDGIQLQNYSKMNKNNFREILTVLKHHVDGANPHDEYNFVDFKNYAILLTYFEKYFDFHKWYDNTSKQIEVNTTQQSATLANLQLPNNNEINTDRLIYGGAVPNGVDNAGNNINSNVFYKLVLKTIIQLLINANNNEIDFNPMILYCIGNNVSYYLAKRYLYKTIGGYKVNDENKSLYDWLIEKDRNINVIDDAVYTKLYNEGLTVQNSTNNDPLFNNCNKIYAMYQYEMLKYVIQKKSTQFTVNGGNINGNFNENESNKKSYKLKFINNQNDTSNKEIVRWIFKRLSKSFIRKHNEAEYYPKDTSVRIPEERDIKSLVRGLGRDLNDGMSLKQKFEYNKFFATNTLNQAMKLYPGYMSGGKFFCGGAAVSANNMFNGTKLYTNIYNNIKQKVKDMGSSLNHDDDTKINQLIKSTGNLETELYEILSTMNKYVSLDEASKHEQVNFEQMADAVSKFERTMNTYNRKSYIVFKDLSKIINVVNRVVNDNPALLR